MFHTFVWRPCATFASKHALLVALSCSLVNVGVPVASASARNQGGDVSPPIAPDSIQGTPLVKPERQGEKLFARLGEKETGIRFANTLSVEHQRNFTFNGAGLASGDFDGDGLTDLYLVTEEGQSKLYRNLGGFRFADVTTQAGIKQDKAGFAIGASFADIDNDHDLDLFLTNWNMPNTLYRNNGDGTFTDITDTAGVGYNGGSTTATFADYDRDGDLDFYVATYRPADLAAEIGTPKLEMKDGQIVIPDNLKSSIELFETKKGLSVRQLGEPDLLYRNNGDGTFTEVAKQAGISGGYWGLSASFSDIDNDGWPDLYVTNDFWSPDMFYHNNGDGTFTLLDAERVQQTPMFAMGMDFADINNDGLTDYFVGDMLSQDATLRLTQHGLMDTTLPPDESAAQVMHNGLYLNNGDGSFSEISWFAGVAASEWTWSTKFADIDLDGYVDLLISNGMIGDLMDSDVLANINLPQFKNAPAYYENYPKLATPNNAFRNNGDLTFSEVSALWGIDDESIAHGATLADLDNDGDLDKVDNFMNEPLGVYRNNALKNRILVELVGYRSNSFGIGARVTVTSTNGQKQTRMMTTSGGYLSSHAPVLVFGLDDAETIKQIEVNWPSGHSQTFTDIEQKALLANQRYVIAEPDSIRTPPPPRRLQAENTQFAEVGATAGLTHAHIEANFDDRQYEGYDDFEEQLLLPRRLSAIGPGVSWADMDADGDDDLYVAGAHGQAGTVYQNLGDGRFDPISNNIVPAALEELATVWYANGAFVSSFSRYEVPNAPIAAIMANNNGLQFQADASGGALALNDMDGDGDLDIFIGGRAIPNQWPLPASSYIYRNDGATYTNVTAEKAPGLLELGLATGAMWLDIDNDQDSDLLIATEYGPVRLFINDKGAFRDATKTSGLQKWHGLWSGITAGDFNEDGYMDFAVANWGMNTRYHASEKYPAMLYAGNIDGDGDLDIVEAEYVDGVLRPMRERGMVGAEMPFVYEKFDTFRAYAEATLAEIYDDRLLGEGVMTLYANTLKHAVFINDGQGHFSMNVLPGLVQATTGYGITAADFDNDGHEDLYLVGNFSHMDHEFRQFSGGISYLLKGNGDGTFTEVPSTQSGLFVPYDGRGVAVSDYNKDGWVDIAVGVNDERPLLFKNTGIDGQCALTLRLQGSARNPLGIGARITVTRSDGMTTSRDVQAGSGYFSQDSAVHLFGLGKSEQVTVKVLWPDGTQSTKSAAQCGNVTLTQ
ncbi:FG-GAP repeat domain protein [Oleiphilus messinensis]|uniref:FG-GAP repeat domain protein n=1 Tax=Oleiphilus messinensis TaxID=141451 RepID=A0A1Y0I438_9GAMM|nr:FG-GAP-like repeat-containing protein [Oleiphilus messinensis]ARU55247.1 FG-GAP repeat domain protein [Oleiphilus messinensis]